MYRIGQEYYKQNNQEYYKQNKTLVKITKINLLMWTFRNKYLVMFHLSRFSQIVMREEQ